MSQNLTRDIRCSLAGEKYDGCADRSAIRIGIDFGGTKIEAAALDGDGAFRSRARVATPDSYDKAIAAVGEAIARAEASAGSRGTIGIGAPGAVFLRQRP